MKKVLILALALVLLLGIAARGTFGLFSDTETSAGNTFTAWVEECVCEKFNVSDKGKDSKIYKYDDDGDPAGSFDLSGSGSPVGVAAVGGYIYVLDHPDHRVYKYDCCGNLVDVSKKLIPSAGGSIANPKGLAIDIAANEMWVVSDTDKEIYKYSLSAAFPDTGTPLPASPDAIPLDTNQQKVRGLAIDSSHLYVLDYETSSKKARFYRYPRSGGSATISRVLAETAASGGAKLESPAGAMFDDTSMWVVDSGENKVYKYDDLVNLFSGSGTLNAAFEFALDINNDNASGV